MLNQGGVGQTGDLSAQGRGLVRPDAGRIAGDGFGSEIPAGAPLVAAARDGADAQAEGGGHLGGQQPPVEGVHDRAA